MKKNKRIILVGPSASGKNFMRETFLKKGFTGDVSYTTRNPRPNEKNGVDYNFISTSKFAKLIENKSFYEWTKYKGNLYGTGIEEWNSRDIFIMETTGVSKINSKDRESCVIFYLDPPTDSRIKRMIIERGWKWDEIAKRLSFDDKHFKAFSDYDITITNPYF